MSCSTFRTPFPVLVLTGLCSLAAFAQGTDYSKVQIKPTHVAGNLWTLEGSGGMIGVFAGPDGILMVDSQFAPLSDKIAAAVKQINPGPIKFLVDTHVHADHTGGNENFAKMGATIFSRDELRYRLAHPTPGAQGVSTTPASDKALPMVTYRGPVTFHMNGEEVELIPIIKAHTDGDTLVRFPAEDVIMTGDFYRSVGYPNIDILNGGSLKGITEGLGELIGLCGPSTKVIPGHGPTVDRAAVVAHRDMLLAIRDKIAVMVKQGKTIEEVVAAKPTSDFDAKVAQAAGTSERFVRQVYQELKTPSTM